MNNTGLIYSQLISISHTIYTDHLIIFVSLEDYLLIKQYRRHTKEHIMFYQRYLYYTQSVKVLDQIIDVHYKHCTCNEGVSPCRTLAEPQTNYFGFCPILH